MTTDILVIDALKGFLKQQGKTYKDVADWLDLSEGSVKRLFSQSDMSLARLAVILDCLGLDMNDLVATMDNKIQQISRISSTQEKALVADIPAMLTALAVLNLLSFEEIIEHYDFSESQVEKALLKLDKMKIISLLPNNRYRLIVHPHFRWLAGGPIQQFFMDNLAETFVKDRIREKDRMLLLNPMLNDDGQQKLDQLIDDFTQRIQQLNISNRALPLSEKNVTFLVLTKRFDWKSGMR